MIEIEKKDLLQNNKNNTKNNNNNNNNSTAVYTTRQGHNHPREHFRGGRLQEDGVHVQLGRDLHFLLQALRWQARLLRWTGKNDKNKGDHSIMFHEMFHSFESLFSIVGRTIL